jgi:hypothetical protein
MFKENLNHYYVHDRYGVFFLGIWTDTIYQSAYYFVFTIRRWILGLNIILMQGIPAFQMFVFILSNVAYLTYLTIHQPHDEVPFNMMELFNESMTAIQAYFLILLCDAEYDDDVRLIIGWFFLMPACFILVVNAGKLLFIKITIILPDYYNIYKNWNENRKFKKFMASWVQQKRTLLKKHPKSMHKKIDYRNTKELVHMFEVKKLLLAEYRQLKREERWLLESSLDAQFLQP